MTKTIKIVYYSGTGGTKRVAQYFRKYFKREGWEVNMQHLRVGDALDYETNCDFLLLIYAVHACNAPKPVYQWIQNLKEIKEIPAGVISVSGGGEVSPNTACRVSTINRLERKGYKVIYEKMLVMPSNWIIPAKTPIDLMLLDVLPAKVELIVEEIIEGKKLRTKPLLIDKVFSYVGEVEKVGAMFFGKRIKVSEDCIGCGWCAKHCPAGNIALDRGKPHFGGQCHLCLGCIYGCPSKALNPGIAKFIVIKEGYDLVKLEKQLPCPKNVDVEQLTKGYLWSGVRKYLLNKEE